MSNLKIKTLTIWSPIFIIFVLFLIAVLVGNLIGVWVWVPIVIVYWALMASLIWINGGKEKFMRWLGPSEGRWYWNGLALVLVIPLLPSFFENYQLFSTGWILLLGLGIVIINPWLEEGYWRGLLLDRLNDWPKGIALLYSSVLFAVGHLALGVYSIASRHPIAIIAIGFMGMVWGVIYHKTKSLRWVILGHALVDIFNLTVPALLNLYVPPG